MPSESNNGIFTITNECLVHVVTKCKTIHYWTGVGVYRSAMLLTNVAAMLLAVQIHSNTFIYKALLILNEVVF